MSLKDAKKGDVLIAENHMDQRVIARLDDILFLDDEEKRDRILGIATWQYLEKEGWIIKQPEPLKLELGKVYEHPNIEGRYLIIDLPEPGVYYACLLSCYGILRIGEGENNFNLTKISDDQRPYFVDG